MSCLCVNLTFFIVSIWVSSNPFFYVSSNSSIYLSIYIFISTGALALQSIGKLSGGQKSRVVLSMLTITRPHLLLLDEPTNNLDMDSISTLKSALKTYQGAYIIASHDMNFVKDICMDIYHVIPYRQQQQQLLQSMQQRAKNASQVKKKSGSSSSGSGSSTCGSSSSSVRKLEDGVDEYREIVRKAVESQKKLCT